MALQINMADSRVGIPVPEAYARVAAVNIDFTKGEVHVAVNVYANAAAAASGKAPVDGAVFKVDPAKDGVDLDAPVGLRAMAYGFLKKQASFAGSKDV